MSVTDSRICAKEKKNTHEINQSILLIMHSTGSGNKKENTATKNYFIPGRNLTQCLKIGIKYLVFVASCLFSLDQLSSIVSPRLINFRSTGLT